jgi:hypothetical protein
LAAKSIVPNKLILLIGLNRVFYRNFNLLALETLYDLIMKLLENVYDDFLVSHRRNLANELNGLGQLAEKYLF